MLTLTRNIKCLSLERSQQPELSGSHSLKLSKRESQGVLWRGPGWRVSMGKRGRRDAVATTFGRQRRRLRREVSGRRGVWVSCGSREPYGSA